MAKVKNVSGQDLVVPALGRMVLDGQVIDVDDEQVYGLTQQSIWEAADDDAEAIHEDASGGEPDEHVEDDDPEV